MSMNEDRFAGTGKNLGGRVEQGFGRATGDELEGKIKQATRCCPGHLWTGEGRSRGRVWESERGRWRRSKVGAGTRCAVGRVSAQRH